ncbi:M15 family metallopeptidase [Mycobacterium sp. smrl_JER01]|uniref:M15 family metallopeptidase n=1 Tax=Mycobacterium sp. smrl_JER01 TaxID=3402633 RepID=UPI003AD6DCA0
MNVVALRCLIIGALTAVAAVGSSATGTASPVPPLSEAARAAGLVDVRSVVPDAVIDLRYATEDNFVGIALYPAAARCLVHESLAPGLRIAANLLRPGGERLVFWDCYRPHAVQVRMFEAVPDPAWVARPGPYARSHVAGRSVDVTLAGAGGLLDMGTGFDDFSSRSLAYAVDGVSAAAQANRARLRDAMTAGGFTVYDGEWWHFDGPGAAVERPILDVPLD